MTKLVAVLKGERCWPPPVWLMRQAGRYLPEYREVRARAGSFVDLCHAPELAAKVTLQPIRRFRFDAAIVFADILLVAGALGQELRFEEGEGPVLGPALAESGLGGLGKGDSDRWLAPVSETIGRVRGELGAETEVIGFCGGPWTVATYMAAGRAIPGHLPARLWAARDRAGFGELIDRLVEVSAGYLVAQARAGAGVLKIFDSWAGILPEAEFTRWVIEPTRALVGAVRSVVPDVPIIGFPRGAGDRYEAFVRGTGVDAVALDHGIGGAFGRERLQSLVPVQGNVDPIALLAGGAALDEAVDRSLGDYGRGPLVCNLGHGIDKATPPDHVAALVNRVRAAPDPSSGKERG